MKGEAKVPVLAGGEKREKKKSPPVEIIQRSVEERLFLNRAKPHSLYFKRRSCKARWRGATNEVLADAELSFCLFFFFFSFPLAYFLQFVSGTVF